MKLRDRFEAAGPGLPTLVIQRQRATGEARGDVLYVHGATFGADLSVFFPFDGRSWADALCEAGFDTWGFDFAGYGLSDRVAQGAGPACAMPAALDELHRVVGAIRQRNGGRPLFLLAHSRGGAVAAAHAARHPGDVRALALFGPIVTRVPVGLPPRGPALQSHYALSAWAQYRRFVEDVPRGQAQVLSESHMHAWAAAFLASDAQSGTRDPPSVLTPSGPLADIAAMWSGRALYDASRIEAPTLLVRGEWDSVCNDADAAVLMAALGTHAKRDVRIAGATHLMHLERQRVELHAEVNRFFREVAQ